MQVYTTTQKGERFNIVCRSESTRYGFRHVVEVVNKYGCTLSRGKVCYYNRTWEHYCYQTAIYEALERLELESDKAANAKRIKALKKQIDRKAGYIT